VKEIRDIKTRESLNVVLYTLKFKEPSADALRFGKNYFLLVVFLIKNSLDILVTNYAKKTGDYAFLSAVDLRLLALTYQLYEENVGTDKLNLEPKINVNC
jgi:RNA-binding protein NOB1